MNGKEKGGEKEKRREKGGKNKSYEGLKKKYTYSTVAVQMFGVGESWGRERRKLHSASHA